MNEKRTTLTSTRIIIQRKLVISQCRCDAEPLRNIHAHKITGITKHLIGKLKNRTQARTHSADSVKQNAELTVNGMSRFTVAVITNLLLPED